MELSYLAFPFSISAFVYLILAVQLYSGVLPIYRSKIPTTSAEVGRQIPRLFIPFGALAGGLVAEMPFILIISGLASVWGGLSFRKDLRTAIDGPPQWLLNPLYVPQIVMTNLIKWPMLPFDCWTVGSSALLFMLFSP